MPPAATQLSYSFTVWKHSSQKWFNMSISSYLSSVVGINQCTSIWYPWNAWAMYLLGKVCKRMSYAFFFFSSPDPWWLLNTRGLLDEACGYGTEISHLQVFRNCCCIALLNTFFSFVQVQWHVGAAWSAVFGASHDKILWKPQAATAEGLNGCGSRDAGCLPVT